MSNIDKHIDKQALREAADRATESDWIVDAHEGWHAVIPVADAVNGNYIIAEFQGPESKRNRDFVAAANPATVLALLDELEAAEKRIAELERDETQLIEERDSAEQALADMYEAAMGDRPEWSNLFGYSDAIDDVAQRISFLDIADAAAKGE